ncbi:MAG: DUF4157 domain-containing protein [Xenococcaceae cyanobacterium]
MSRQYIHKSQNLPKSTTRGILQRTAVRTLSASTLKPEAEIEELNSPESQLQQDLTLIPVNTPQTVQRQAQIKTENQTGLPDRLKAGIEKLSGMSMDDVKVHYNSSKPSQLQALAYTQGTEIHLGLGQEKHLPHEGWHVVQQKQGRVKPTLQLKGVMINDTLELENEAEVMGSKALESKSKKQQNMLQSTNNANSSHCAIQGVFAGELQGKRAEDVIESDLHRFRRNSYREAVGAQKAPRLKRRDSYRQAVGAQEAPRLKRRDSYRQAILLQPWLTKSEEQEADDLIQECAQYLNDAIKKNWSRFKDVGAHLENSPEANVLSAIGSPSQVSGAFTEGQGAEALAWSGDASTYLNLGGSTFQALKGFYEIVTGIKEALANDDQTSFYGKKKALQGLTNTLKGGAETTQWALGTAGGTAATVGGHFAAPLAGVSAARHARKAVRAHKRISGLGKLDEELALTGSNREIGKYAQEKNQKLRTRMGAGATIAGLGVAGGIVSATGVGFPVGLALGLVAAAAGGGLGLWKLYRWGKKKFQASQTLRQARKGENASTGFKGFAQDLKSTLTRGKTKIGKELETAGVENNPLKEREKMARQLLMNVTSSDLWTQWEAYEILEVLFGKDFNKIKSFIDECINKSLDPANDSQLIEHVMQKLRSA